MVDNSVVYRRYIHKCNQETQSKGRQLWYTEGIFTNAIKKHNLREDNCGIQKVYSHMQSKNTILGWTTLCYTEIHKCNLRKQYKEGQLCGIQKVNLQMQS